jgi:hypothetical protein
LLHHDKTTVHFVKDSVRCRVIGNLPWTKSIHEQSLRAPPVQGQPVPAAGREAGTISSSRESLKRPATLHAPCKAVPPPPSSSPVKTHLLLFAIVSSIIASIFLT